MASSENERNVIVAMTSREGEEVKTVVPRTGSPTGQKESKKRSEVVTLDFV